MKISPAMRATDAFVTRRALLVPICLCVIAVGHAYRVFACGQTAWKGGGFGMFSTVDAENARYVKIYLTTDQGEVPVELPSELRKPAAELRAAPNQSSTDALARRLAKLNWRDGQVSWSRMASNLQSGIVTAHLLHAAEKPIDSPHVPPAGSRSTLTSTTSSIANGIVLIHKVRVEVWRYRYDATTHVLSSELLFNSISTREEQ